MMTIPLKHTQRHAKMLCNTTQLSALLRSARKFSPIYIKNVLINKPAQMYLRCIVMLGLLLLLIGLCHVQKLLVIMDVLFAIQHMVMLRKHTHTHTRAHRVPLLEVTELILS